MITPKVTDVIFSEFLAFQMTLKKKNKKEKKQLVTH